MTKKQRRSMPLNSQTPFECYDSGENISSLKKWLQKHMSGKKMNLVKQNKKEK
jgi:hypothetical protein